MTARKSYLGKIGPATYDDASGDIYPEDGVPVTGVRIYQGRCEGAPVEWFNFINLKYFQDNAFTYKRSIVSVLDIYDPSPELSLLDSSTSGGVIIVYQDRVGINLWSIYVFDAVSTDAPGPPYRVSGATGLWVANGGWVMHGAVIEDGILPGVDETGYVGLSAQKFSEGHFKNLTVSASPSAGTDVANKTYVDGVAGGSGDTQIQIVSVADINSPGTELGTKAASDGPLLLAYLAAAGHNTYTLYASDTSDSASVLSPYVLAGSGCKWIAIAGLYVYNNLHASGTLFGGGLTLTGPAALAGITSITGNPSIDAAFNGTQTITTSTDTAITLTEVIDQTANFSSSTFTVPSGGTGRYMIHVGADGIGSSINGYLCVIKILKNSATVHTAVGNSSIGEWGMSGARMFLLSAGDTITFKFRQDTGADLTLNNMYITINKVG